MKAILTVDIHPLPGEIIKGLVNYLHVKLRDESKENLIENLDTTFAFIKKCQDEKTDLLIHCVAGISRSPSILIAYLMKANKLNFDQAFELVKKKRTQICCNDGFRNQLRLYFEMNWELNINYRPYRYHQLSYLSNLVNNYLVNITNANSMTNLKGQINNFIAKFHDNNSLNSGKIIFKCKKCRLYLFNDVNLLIDNSNTTLNNCANLSSIDLYNNVLNSSCGNLYIEPTVWMLNDICQSASGNLVCNNCFNRLGKFRWQGINCAIDCSKHSNIVPSFKIDQKKVDHHIL